MNNPMTVRDLIRTLQRADPNALVVVRDNEEQVLHATEKATTQTLDETDESSFDMDPDLKLVVISFKS